MISASFGLHFFYLQNRHKQKKQPQIEVAFWNGTRGGT